jgi:nucleotide-binding universal stress UspA family protein
MSLFRRVTVALADAATDRYVLEYARVIHDSIGVGAFDFVHVLPDAGTISLAPARNVPTHAAAIEAVRRHVRVYFPDLTDGCHVLNGSRLDKLLEHTAEQASDAILLGHRTARTGRRSLVRRLAMKAPCSLWMLPEGAAPRISHVLAGVDFSASSADALAMAAFLASRMNNKKCTAVHIATDDTLVDSGVFERFVSALDLKGVAVETRVEKAPTATHGLLKTAEAEHADLIVMGTRGTSSSAAVLLGNESEQMLTESRLPVLVTRPRGERLGLLEILLDRDLQAR